MEDHHIDKVPQNEWRFVASKMNSHLPSPSLLSLSGPLRPTAVCMGHGNDGNTVQDGLSNCRPWWIGS